MDDKHNRQTIKFDRQKREGRDLPAQDSFDCLLRETLMARESVSDRQKESIMSIYAQFAETARLREQSDAATPAAAGAMASAKTSRTAILAAAPMPVTVQATSRRRRRFWRPQAAVAASLLLLIGLTTLFHPVVQATIGSWLEGLRYSLSEAFGERKLADYSSVVHSVVEDQGIALQIEELCFYEDRIDMSYIIHNSHDPEEKLVINNLNFVLNGQVFDRSKFSEAVGARVTDGVNYAYSSFYIQDLTNALTKEMDVKIEISALHSVGAAQTETRSYPGQWNFSFQMDGLKMIESSRVISLNKSIRLEDGVFVLDELRIRPTGEFELLGHEQSDLVHLPKPTDRYQTESEESRIEPWIFEWRARDEQGESFVFSGSHGSRERLVFRCGSVNGSAAPDPSCRSLVLQLYGYRLPSDGQTSLGELMRPLGEEIVLELNP